MNTVRLDNPDETRFAPLAGELLRLAAPLIGVTVSRMLMGFIDFAMVSTLGTAAQAAISPSTLLLFTLACIGMGLSQGVQTFVSQAVGRGEPHKAGAYVWQTTYLAAAATVLSAPLALTVGQWFPLIGAAGHQPPDVQRMEIQFLQMGLWSIGPMTACAGLESFYNGIRRPGISFIAMLGSLLTITIGNYVLIFGHFGAPQLGIAGSGLATALAWTVRLLILLLPLRSPGIDRTYATARSLRFDAARTGEIVRIGGPIALQWLIDIGAWLVFMQLLIPHFGTVAMAGANLAIQYMHLSFMPALGLGLALTTQVGNAVGARRFDMAARRVKVALRLILLYMGLMAALFVLAGRPLAGLLCFEQDPALRQELIEAAGQMLVWVALFQLSDALCIVYSFAFRGAGDTRVPALLFGVCCWGIFIGGGLLVARFFPHWGYHGLWATCTAYIVVLGLLLWWRFRSGAWQRVRVFADSSGVPPAAPQAAAAAPAAGAAETGPR